MSLPENIESRIKLLEEKFNAMGQDLTSYLDGLLYADYLTYWDYIHLDTLLSLQSPKTQFPDEEVFIMYHQITELYFKLSIHEFKQISNAKNITVDLLIQKLQRINRYFVALTDSFSIMVDGMEPEQFQKFRMSLLPASGFQSAQYRSIEIYSTEFERLVSKDLREKINSKTASVEEMFEHIYWKAGATELSSGKKTLTLLQFENKYSNGLIKLASDMVGANVFSQYKKLSLEDQNNETLIKLLKQLDVNVNINWPLSHYKSAVKYLQRDPVDIAATGGTNWQKYLPPRFQKRIFYSELWSQEELENWGKAWVEDLFKN